MAFFENLNWLYPLAGLLVGVLVGMTGVGGGSLMTPVLVLLFNFHPATAVGTDLLFASMTKSVGSAVHGWRNTVDWRIVWRLALGSVPAATLTLLVLNQMGPPSKETAKLITYVLGSMLILTSFAVLFQGRIVYWATSRFGSNFSADRAWPTTLLGVLLGTIVSISSVGAGAIGVTALLILYPRMSVAKIVGSDIAHAVPLTMVAGVGHLWIGNVDLNLLASLLVGSVPGVIIGSYIGSGASDRFLRPMLAGVLILVGFKLLTS